MQYTLEWPQDLGAIAVTRQGPSQAKPPLDLVVGNAFSSIQFGQSGVDLREKNQALDCVIHRRVWRQLTEGLDYSIA